MYDIVYSKQARAALRQHPVKRAARILEIFEMIAANPPLHVQASKTLAKACREMPFAAGLLQGDLMGEVLRALPDSREGPRAFMEKRPPRYTGKTR